MNQLLSDTSYIICYRESSRERHQALLFVLRQLRKNFPEIEILIVEQDSKSKLNLDESLNIRHLFITNFGLFNRSWAFNCAAKKTAKDIYVFADADIILEKEGFLKCVNAMNDFEAITPNKVEITNVNIDKSKDQLQILNKRDLYSFAGGILFITRNGFDKIGGWDERFEGWGGEDNAMSHLIYNRLRSKTFNLVSYHIDHPREFVSGNNHNQPQYETNRALVEEILTRNGNSQERYIQQLKTSGPGNPKKYKSTTTQEVSSKKIVLAITTYNRLNYLKKCVESFFNTRTDTISWQLIIADDNSTDGTKEYLKNLKEKHNAIIIHNDRMGIHHQVNSIIKALSNSTFDLCFKCDDDVTFIKKGWDQLYWKTIKRTGYDHLIFYDKNWQPHSNLSRPNQFGNLIANCLPDKIQGAFYTLTKELIDKVGYFDVQQFGTSGLGHIDYSFRCCRAGYNVLANPFDVENSNQFIQLQSVQKYLNASSLKNKTKSNSKSTIAFKKQVLGMDRIYIPYNENLHKGTDIKEKSAVEVRAPKRQNLTKYKKADSTFYSERGIIGFAGFVLKRIYNLSIDSRLYFIPIGINLLGRTLNKISIHLINIEQ